jgi:PST family polysaccharide transporter
MGFIVLAKGRQNIFFLSDLAWTAVYIVLAWGCVRRFGLMGAGIAFFASYIFHVLLTYPIVRQLSGFRWSRENRNIGILFLGSIAAVFCGFCVLPFAWAASLGTCATLLIGAYSLRVLLKLISMDRVPWAIRRLLLPFSSLFANLSER